MSHFTMSWHRQVGLYYVFADIVFGPTSLCHFFTKTMAVNITNFGFINYKDNHREYNIHTSGNNIADIIRQCEAEDIQAEDVKAEPAVAKNATTAQQPLPFFVPDKLQALELYTIEQFEQMYRKAVESDAHTLADFLHKYEKLEVFDFHGYEKREVYDSLRSFFPTMKEYSYTNFIYYF